MEAAPVSTTAETTAVVAIALALGHNERALPPPDSPVPDSLEVGREAFRTISDCDLADPVARRVFDGVRASLLQMLKSLGYSEELDRLRLDGG